MEEHAVLAAHRTELRHGLNRADLVVRSHDGNDGRVRPNGLFQFFGRHAAIFVHRQIGYFKAFLFQLLAGMQYGVVLDGGRDDMAALLDVLIRRAAHRPIVRFSAAAREINLVGVRANGRRHLLARRGHRVLGLVAVIVH